MGEAQRELRLSPGVPCFAPHWRNIATHGQELGTDLHATSECRLNAARCLELAETATTPELRRLAAIWKELAAELESDQALLKVLAELDLSPQPCEPYEALPYAMKLHSWAA